MRRASCASPTSTPEPRSSPSASACFTRDKDARKALIDIAAARELCLKVLGLEDERRLVPRLPVGQVQGRLRRQGAAGPARGARADGLVLAEIEGWPFPGRVALRERDAFPDGRVRDLHVLDRWTYLGTARSEEELAPLRRTGRPGAFDAHVYRILVRYLANHPKLDWHDLEPRRHTARRCRVEQ